MTKWTKSLHISKKNCKFAANFDFMNEFWKRTLSGAVYVAVVVSSILFHPAFFGAVFAIISLLAVREFYHLMKSPRPNRILAELAAVLLFLIAWMPVGLAETCYGFLMIVCVAAYCLSVLAGLIAELWMKAEDPVRNWGNLLQSQVMIALPVALMAVLMFFDKYLLLAVFVLIWVNDSGAYCVGSLTAKRPGGNHKMFPRVSPKKSWEGLFGGIALAVGVSALLAYCGWFDWLEKFSSLNVYLTAALFAMVVAVFGTLGDLMESLLKRTIGVKDSGKFLPGHGGVLDRFDSILLAIPTTLLLVIIVSQC